MNLRFHRADFLCKSKKCVSLFVAILLLATPLWAQRPTTPPAQPQAKTPKIPDPTFETLLGADTYKLYGEVRNVGQLLSTGGAGEIVDPIIKLANPPQEFQSIIKFLKKNEEALATSRLLFASWPARADVPNAFVAIEFATPEEAAKFSPKLETFLPTVLPPVPIEPEPKPNIPPEARPSEPGKQPVAETRKEGTQASPPAERRAGSARTEAPQEHLPFVISHKGNLVFISDKSFKFEKLHPVSSKALAEDQNFRIAHDRFSNESIFLYFSMALEDRSKPLASPTPVVTVEVAEPSARSQSYPSTRPPNLSSETPDETRNVM